MMNRREALTRLGSFMAMGLVGSSKATANTSATESLTTGVAISTSAQSEPITIAHITDVHITPERNAEKWLAECLHSIQSHPSAPKLILNSGDSVYETLKEDRAKSDALWALWNGVLKRENSLPVHHCLGNHDIWGWGIKDNPSIKSDPAYGKKLGLDNYGIERSYYSFDQGPWHFIALDSCTTDPNSNGGWVAELDDEQFQWLQQDLKSIPANRPVLIYSHIPIIQVASHRVMEPYKGWYRFSPWSMHRDARRLIDLFAQHSNVKLCLSGHLHLQDRIELSGVTYMCAGAVSGNWWKGMHVDCGPGYTILTLNPDGTFNRSYEGYNWKNEAPIA